MVFGKPGIPKRSCLFRTVRPWAVNDRTHTSPLMFIAVPAAAITSICIKVISGEGRTSVSHLLVVSEFADGASSW